jgi:hypothetical protein
LDGKSHLGALLEALMGDELAVGSKEEAIRNLPQSDAQPQIGYRKRATSTNQRGFLDCQS